MRLSCYLVDSKTRQQDSRSFMTWPVYVYIYMIEKDTTNWRNRQTLPITLATFVALRASSCLPLLRMYRGSTMSHRNSAEMEFIPDDMELETQCHDDVIKWKHFPRYWSLVLGIHRWPINSPHKGLWRRAMMFSLICALNKRLSKQSWGWWFETSSRPLWCQCNVQRERFLTYTFMMYYKELLIMTFTANREWVQILYFRVNKLDMHFP